MQKEVIDALRRIEGVIALAIDIVPHPSAEQAQCLTEILESRGCDLLFTINEWGMDSDGILFEFINKKRLLHINWCVDDPFYEELMKRKKYRPCARRIDFVSDRGYVARMKQCGYNVHFLPLGTEQRVFFPQDSEKSIDVSFVGNSYLPQIDEFARNQQSFLEQCFPFLADLISKYLKNTGYPLEEAIYKRISGMKLPENLSPDWAQFIAKHLAGFLHRRQLVKLVAGKFPGFVVFGDAGWKDEIDDERLKKVKYGEELRKVYNSTKVNIDINRVVIRDGFTQRVFDVLASGEFLITSYKPVIKEFFITEGPQKELVTFSSYNELISLIEYYLKHEDERRQIADRGYRKVISMHTYDHRLREAFRIISEEISKFMLPV